MEKQPIKIEYLKLYLEQKGLKYNVELSDKTYSKNNTIYICKSHLETFSDTHLQAIILHEIAHLYYRHTLKSNLLNIGFISINILAIVFCFVFNLNFINIPITIAITLIVKILNNWFQEFVADSFATMVTGFITVSSLLSKLKNKTSFSHPGYRMRITFLKNLNLKKF